MSERHPHWFPERDPPPGGLARLRTRLDGRASRALTLALLPALAATAALVIFVVTRPPARTLTAMIDHPALAEGAQSPGLAVPLSDHATLYWVP